MRSHELRSIRGSILALALAGCGGASGGGSGAFSPSYPDNDSATLGPALAQVAHAAATAAPDVAVAVTEDGHHLIGFDTSTGSSLYRVDVETTVPILTTGTYVLVEETGRVRIFDLATGHARLSIDLGSNVTPSHLIGADASGPLLAVSLSTATGTTARSRLVIVRGDSIAEDIALDRPLGVPAVAGSTILVPWAYQFLSVMDAAGNEQTRIRLRNGIVGHAIASQGRAWFGGAELHRLTSSSATEVPVGYAPPNLGIDRPPSLLTNAYDAPAPLSSAMHNVRLVFAPDATGTEAPPRPTDGLLYLVYFRFVFALDATDGTPRWVRPVPSDVVGAAAFAGGIRLAAESGEILTLSAVDGRAHASASIGEAVSYVSYPRSESLALGEPVEAERPDVRVQLMEAVQVADARLVTAREFALARLAVLPDDDATADLTLLCEDTRLPPRTKQRACDFLATRPVGADHVLSQLSRHGSFLDERVGPPVAALARAAGNMRVAASVPLLIEQFRDPRTPIAAIAPIADAFVAIGDATAVPVLAAFLRTYHADSSEFGMVDALGSVANAYARLGGPTALTEIDALASDNLAPLPVARALREAATRVRTTRNTTSATTATTTTVATTTSTAALPTHLSLELANPVLSGVNDQLITCLRADPSRPNSARVIIVARRDGTVAEVLVSPDSLATCVYPLISPLQFPATRGTGTARLTFTLHAR